jgi:hypothetical protein
MAGEQNKNAQGGETSQTSIADTGNASNPSQDTNRFNPQPGSQLLDEKAERYLREAGNIEDMPDAQERKELDEKPGPLNDNG